MTIFLLPVILIGLNYVQTAGSVDQCRDLYFMENTNENAQTFYNFCFALRADDPLTRAYQGSALSRIAGFGFNPYTKYSRFSKGRELIEQAVLDSPADAEIRFIRLSIQLNAPAFLNYDNNIADDKQIVVKALLNRSFALNRKFEKNMSNFMLKHADCSPETQAGLRILN